MSILDARLKKREVVPVYSQVAPVYDLWGRLAETQARKKALVLANIRNGESILEVAIGTGLTFLELLKANPDGYNVGVDLTPAMLEKAKAKGAESGAKNYEIAIGDAYDLKFPDHRFDLLVNNYMFDLLPERDFALVLAEFKRVLKPGGRLVLVNMTKGEHEYEQLWELIYRLNAKWMGGCRGVLLSPAVSRAGFTDLHRETISQLGFPSELITARA